MDCQSRLYSSLTRSRSRSPVMVHACSLLEGFARVVWMLKIGSDVPGDLRSEDYHVEFACGLCFDIGSENRKATGESAAIVVASKISETSSTFGTHNYSYQVGECSMPLSRSCGGTWMLLSTSPLGHADYSTFFSSFAKFCANPWMLGPASGI
ncbi:hypothetical protein BKA81DRAFT_21786 [Phyllosticta paracitricarpa]